MPSHQHDIDIACEIRPADFRAFIDYYYNHTTEGKHGRNRMLILGLLLFGVFAFSEYGDRQHGIAHPLHYTGYLLAVGGLIALVIFLYHRLLRPWLIRFFSRNVMDRAALGPTQIRFTDNQIEIQNEASTNRVPWHAVHNLGETSSHVFLITGPMQAIIIPKRDLPATEHSTQLCEWLKKQRAQAGSIPGLERDS